MLGLFAEIACCMMFLLQHPVFLRAMTRSVLSSKASFHLEHTHVADIGRDPGTTYQNPAKRMIMFNRSFVRRRVLSILREANIDVCSFSTSQA